MAPAWAGNMVAGGLRIGVGESEGGIGWELRIHLCLGVGQRAALFIPIFEFLVPYSPQFLSLAVDTQESLTSAHLLA